MRSFLVLLALLGALLSLSFAGAARASTATAKPTLVASVEPLAMVLRSLYGDQAKVVTLLDPNQNPHHPMLSPRQMLIARQADLLVWLGGAAEPAVAALVKERRGESLALLDLPGVTRHQGHEHEHEGAGPEEEAGHQAGLDPHLWLDPNNMALLARALGERHLEPLAAGQPDAFLQALARTEQTLRAELAPWADTPWLTYHHPWAYFQHRFGLRDPVIISEQLGAGPSSRRFVALANTVRTQNVSCALVEPEAQASLLRRLCPECRLHALDPLGRDHAGLAYDAWLARVADGFRACLAGDH